MIWEILHTILKTPLVEVPMVKFIVQNIIEAANSMHSKFLNCPIIQQYQKKSRYIISWVILTSSIVLILFKILSILQ